MHVGMVGQRLAPRVQNCREADLGTEVLGIARNLLERLCRRLEEKAVDDLLVLVADGSNLLRQCEDHVKILDRQQVGLALFQPSAGGRALARRAMSVPAAAVGDLGKSAVRTAPDVPSQRRRTAGLDRRHDATLAAIEMAGIGLTISLTMTAEDIYRLFCQLL